MSTINRRTEHLFLAALLIVLIWPLSMIILGLRYRNECTGQSSLPIYHVTYGSLWILFFLLNLIRYNSLVRFFDVLSILIWLVLLLLIVPGYVLIFDLRSQMRMIDSQPANLCHQLFYTFSCVSIILIHIPLYIFLWLLWSFTHSNEFNRDRSRSTQVFAIDTPMSATT
jgi:hypothetical protein